jgi:hypothetical protein
LHPAATCGYETAQALAFVTLMVASSQAKVEVKQKPVAKVHGESKQTLGNCLRSLG